MGVAREPKRIRYNYRRTIDLGDIDYVEGDNLFCANDLRKIRGFPYRLNWDLCYDVISIPTDLEGMSSIPVKISLDYVKSEIYNLYTIYRLDLGSEARRYDTSSVPKTLYVYKTDEIWKPIRNKK